MLTFSQYSPHCQQTLNQIKWYKRSVALSKVDVGIHPIMNNLSQDTLYDSNILHLEPKQEPSEIPPNGGWRAWRVAFGAAILMFVQIGLVSSYGTFQAYYVANEFETLTESEISWIGSTHCP